ncbi:hypothetical protein ANN_22923 [Periplaneta americana]|uniref:Uncharacterized protein n=1 Tax=Periplaneta americana TaxID=6978 RepID=A0ABQ8SJM9_PERAM|nr:hypothetical protein ANN_22923 [Periplaneta americana]
MSPGSSTESYPAFARFGLRENPGKNLNQVTCPDRDSNPGHLVSQPDALTVTPQVESFCTLYQRYHAIVCLIAREKQHSLMTLNGDLSVQGRLSGSGKIRARYSICPLFRETLY